MLSFGNSAKRDQSSTYLKFLMNYVLMQSNINKFKFDFAVLNFTSFLGEPVGNLNNASDCQVVSYQNTLLVKAIVSFLLPILAYFWMGLVYCIMSILQNRNHPFVWKILKMRLYTLFLFCFTLFQPSMIQFVIKTMSCRKIVGNKYVTADITLECYTKDHNLVLIVCSVGFFFWISVVPYYIYKRLKGIKNMHLIHTQYKYGFFYLEYNQKCIYWEIVKLYKKLLIVSCANILSE